MGFFVSYQGVVSNKIMCLKMLRAYNRALWWVPSSMFLWNLSIFSFVSLLLDANRRKTVSYETLIPFSELLTLLQPPTTYLCGIFLLIATNIDPTFQTYTSKLYEIQIVVFSKWRHSSHQTLDPWNTVVSQNGGDFSTIFRTSTGHRKSKIWQNQIIFSNK